ncbi:MAG: hypothetical protein IPJ19_00220 [Planctomycetes bacterium]|nr:hypothetical protein [Planctomycetota bacterium]
MSQTTDQDSPLARWALRLCAVWLAAGAVAKLFYGTPALLPQIIRDSTPLSLELTYTLVIGIEFALVALAFLRPRQAWPLFVALFLFFDFVLTTQMRAGAESCGCFGGGLKVSPALMMGVDSALLLFLLVTKPWVSVRRRGAGIGLVLVTLLLAFALPAVWIQVRQSEGPAVVDVPGGTGQTPAPPKAPDWIELHPEKWVGKSVYDIAELTKWVPEEKLPTDGQIVIWRQGCTHCADHLRELANGDKGEHPILLVQIRDDERDSRAVDAMPTGAHVTLAELPAGMQVVLETPWEITVEGGNVTAALDREHLEAAK